MKLNYNLALKAKAMLWAGETNANTARSLGLSDAHVSRISTGNAWAHVPWPDGQLGGFPKSRRAELRGPSRGDLLQDVEGPEVLDTPDIVLRDSHDDGRSPAQGHPHILRYPDSAGPPGSDDTGDDRGDEEKEINPFAEREARKAALDKLGEAVESSLDDELGAALQSKASKARPPARAQAKPDTPPSYEMLRWEDVRTRGKNLPLVAAAEDVEELRPAVCAALYMLPTSQWSSPKAAVLVTDIAKSMGIDMENIFGKEDQDDQMD